MQKSWTKRQNEEQARIIRSSTHVYEGIAQLRAAQNNGQVPSRNKMEHLRDQLENLTHELSVYIYLLAEQKEGTVEPEQPAS